MTIAEYPVVKAQSPSHHAVWEERDHVAFLHLESPASRNKIPVKTSDLVAKNSIIRPLFAADIRTF